MSTSQVFHGCPACGRIVADPFFEDRATGVRYHAACFLRAELMVTPWQPVGYSAVVTQSPTGETPVEAPAVAQA